jgi:malate dehydrogenase
MIPLVNYTTVSGIPIKGLLTADKIERIIVKTKSSGMDVIGLKGSTAHAPAAVIAIMADAVLRGRNRVMGASVVPNGEYGLKDVAVGLPIVLGSNGVERIVELELDEGERRQLKEAADSIQSTIREANPKAD